MEQKESNITPECALQYIKWCADNEENGALEEYLKLHKDKLKHKLISVLCDVFLKRRTGAIRSMLSVLDQEIRTMYQDEKSSFHKLLCSAVEMGDINIVLDLIDKGANVNRHFYGKPLLHIAACCGRLDIVTALVEGGGDINSLDRRGDGIIHSILCSQLENKGPMVRRVKDLGASLLVKSSSGKLPIHLAAKNAPDVLVEIIRDGHDVNTPDDVNKETPLHIACGAACCENILILLQSGCRINTENKNGQTPLAKLLQFTNNIHDFHTKTRLNIAKVLISIGLRMNDQSPKTRTTFKKGRDKCYDRYVSLQMSLNTPSSLQSLARLTIRESLTLNAGVQKEIDKLDIPMNLKSFIMYHGMRL